MKTATITVLAAIGCSLLASQESHANFLGLGGQLHTTVTIGGQDKFVYRIYAVFDNPNDYFGSISGSQITGPMTIQTFTSGGGLGAPFTNPAGGGTMAPTAEAIAANPDVEWDTFATIGMPITNDFDQSGYSPGFPGQFGGQFIIGNTATTSDGAWFTPGASEQGRAGSHFAVNSTFIKGEQTITGMGVLCGQFTVNPYEGVRGTCAVGVSIAGLSGQTLANQTFSIIVPAPGAMMVLLTACAPFVRRRRRRS
jgi:hypothetical protein